MYLVFWLLYTHKKLKKLKKVDKTYSSVLQENPKFWKLLKFLAIWHVICLLLQLVTMFIIMVGGFNHVLMDIISVVLIVLYLSVEYIIFLKFKRRSFFENEFLKYAITNVYFKTACIVQLLVLSGLLLFG